MPSTHEWIKRTWDIFVVVWSLSHIRCFAAPWTTAHQPSLSMGFSRQKYWSGLAFPSPEDHPDPGIEPTSSALQVDSLLLRHQGSLWYIYSCQTLCNCMDCSSQGSSVHGISQGCHFLLQGTFLTQGSNPCLLNCRLILYLQSL